MVFTTRELNSRCGAPASLSLALWWWALLCTASPAPALAQSAAEPPADTRPQAEPVADTLTEVIVTARKRDERLQDVPIAITALDREAIENAHVQSIDDLRALAPNLNIETAEGQTPNVTMRGVGSFGVSQGVGFYVNDVQQFEGQTARLEDIERIEVLRGPQGTLYGGSNIGGAIKYVTRRPTSEFAGQASAEGGARDTRNFSGILSGPIVGNVLLGRLTAYDSRSNGYLDNLTRNERAGDDHTTGGRLTLQGNASDTTVLFYLDGAHQTTTQFVPLFRAPNDRTFLRTIDPDDPGFMKRTYGSATLQIDHVFSGVTLTSLSSAFHSTQNVHGDLDFSPLHITFLEIERKKWIYSQEIRLTSQSDSGFEWLAGAFYQYRREPEDSVFHLYAVPIPGGLAFPGADRVRHQQNAAFGNISYTLGSWIVEAGLRAERDTTDFADALGGDSLAHDDSAVLPRGSLTYRFDHAHMIYGSIARGFRPGSVEDEQRLIEFDAEKTTNYEVGFKSAAFNGRAHVEGALFYIKYVDRVFEQKEVVPFVGLVETNRNIGSSENYGAELSLQTRLTNELTATGSAGYTCAVWDTAVSNNVDLHGTTAPFTPRYQANLTLDWAHPVARDMTFGLRADATFMGRQFWDLGDGPGERPQQRPYELVNLGARLESSRWDLSVHVSNVFDKGYNRAYFTAFQTGLPFDLGYVGPPRAWTAKVAVRF